MTAWLRAGNASCLVKLPNNLPLHFQHRQARGCTIYST